MVCGPAMGGIIVAYELGRQLGKRAIFTERENNVMTLRRGFEIKKGEKVLITEDVVTTGKSSMETAKVIEELGGEVIGIACIVDRRVNDIFCPVYSAMQLEIATYEADECPLCKAGIPLVKPEAANSINKPKPVPFKKGRAQERRCPGTVNFRSKNRKASVFAARKQRRTPSWHAGAQRRNGDCNGTREKAWLVLADGTVLEGASFGAQGTAIGEIVFTTGMTGYQEVLTDPSYYGQIVTQTYPLIGNYGINLDDMESASSHVQGYIVREWCDQPSNFRVAMNIDEYLKQQNIVAISGIDTGI